MEAKLLVNSIQLSFNKEKSSLSGNQEDKSAQLKRKLLCIVLDCCGAGTENVLYSIHKRPDQIKMNA